jgi:hypothetical protein
MLLHFNIVVLNVKPFIILSVFCYVTEEVTDDGSL